MTVNKLFMSTIDVFVFKHEYYIILLLLFRRYYKQYETCGENLNREIRMKVQETK